MGVELLAALIAFSMGVELLAALIAVFEAILFPALTFSTAAILSDYLSRHLENKSKYPSLHVAIAQIAFLVREGLLPVQDITQHLVGFSKDERIKAYSILYETKYLTFLDVDFQDIDEHMLFCQVLASSVSSVHSVLNDLE